jgi:scyllo-inositol 2-dehydrogenase (NADP+)
MENRIRVGLIGFGAAGQFFHAPLIHSLPAFHLAVICERSSNKSEALYPLAKIVKDANAVFEDATIDLVVIATPNSSHFSLAKEALIRGKNVVVDKPFVPTIEEGLFLIQLAKKQNKLLTVFHNRRWDGGFLTVRHLLEKGILGALVEYEARFDRFRNVVNQQAWKEKESPGSGILYDLGSHLIDQALVLFGNPLTVQADIRSQRPGALVDDYFEINLMYPNLKVILKAGVLVREPSAIFTLHGMQGSYVKYGLDPQEGALRAGQSPLAAKFGFEEPGSWGQLNSEVGGLVLNEKMETQPGSYKLFYENVYNAIVHNHPLLVKPWEAINCLKIIAMARASQEEKRTIEFPLFS